MNPYPIVVVNIAKSEKTIGSIEFKEQRLQLLVTSATKMYGGQNNEHDYLEYGCASLE